MLASAMSMLSHESGSIEKYTRYRACGRTPRGLQDLKKRCSDPLGDVGPSFLAHYFGDLASDQKLPEICQGIRCRSRHHSIDGKPPVGKSAGLEGFEAIVQRGHGVSERDL